MKNWAYLALVAGVSVLGLSLGTGQGGGWVTRWLEGDGSIVISHAGHLGGLAFGALAAVTAYLLRRRRLL